MVTALIAGIGGQDGGYLAEQLLAAGSTVHGLIREQDKPRGPRSPDLSAAVLHVADLTDGPAVARLLDDVEPDEIYNLAGISSVARSWAEPVATGLVTGVAVAGLLQAAWLLQERLGRPVRVVQASSAEIFGDPITSPQDENTAIRPMTPYGSAKAYAHHMVRTYRTRGLSAASVILYNHESPRRPVEFVSRKITTGVAAIAAGTARELVLGNLDARRDWGWAPDYVDAMVRAARVPAADDYVIATGVAHSVADFVAAAFARVGISDWRSRVRTDPALFRPADAVQLTGDARLAGVRLGWAPTTTFDEMVAAMVDADLAG